jgi:transposase-like protein
MRVIGDKSRKLVEGDVALVVECRNAGMTQADIAARFGVAQSTVSAMLRGVIWKGLVDPKALTFRGTGHVTGEGHHCAVLSEAGVRRMRRLHGEGRSIASLAREFGCGETTTRKALRRVTWGHVV